MLTKFTSPSEGIEGHRHRPRSQVKKKKAKIFGFENVGILSHFSF